MKKTLVAVAVLLAAGSAFACVGNSCGIPGTSGATASVFGSNAVVSKSTTSATANGAGSGSHSYATNQTSAATTVGATVTAGYKDANCDTATTGSVGVGGSVALKSNSIAYNVSTGNGTGFAAAGGLASGSVHGSGAFSGGNSVGSVGGVAAGHASAQLASGVAAGMNSGAEEVAVAGASFAADSNASLVTVGDCKGRSCVTIADTKVASSLSVSSAYSDKATYAVSGVSLQNAVAGSLVNASADSLASSGGTARVGQTVSAFTSAR